MEGEPLTALPRQVWRVLKPWIPFLLVFAAVDLSWATLLNLGAWSRAVPVVGPHLDAWSGFIDALWHLATGFLVALPARDRRALVLTPLISLGLDLDHTFGLLLPATVGRPDHAFAFLLLTGAIAYAWKGPLAGAIVASGILTHIAVDGGSFPLFDPFSLARWWMPLWGTVVALVVAVGLLLCVAQPRTELLRRPRPWLELALIVAGLGLFMAFIGPSAWLGFLGN